MMELKRYYLKQELEQLPEETWSKLQANDFVCQLNASDRYELAKRVETLPEATVDRLKQTVREIRDRELLDYFKIDPESYQKMLLWGLSERHDGLSDEEDEVWQDL